MAEGSIGKLIEIWRYPVQSMRGEALADTEIGTDGVVGDRAYGIVDPESAAVVSSAQGRRKWRAIVTLAARYRGAPTANGAAAPIDILLPDGTVLAGEQADIDTRLAALLGQPAHLADKVIASAKAAAGEEEEEE